tara:strand:- start:321 stop:1700 length:1380 start_codon:yes stop_codon:yes gene_type:complete
MKIPFFTAIQIGGGEKKSCRTSFLVLILLFEYLSLVPFYHLPDFSFSFGTLLFPPLKYLPFLFSIVLSALFLYRILSPLGKFTNTQLDRYILVFVAIRFLSVFSSEYYTVNLFGKAIYYSMTGPAMYYLIMFAVPDLFRLKIFLKIACWTCFFVSAYGVIGYFIGTDLFYQDIFEVYNPYHKGTSRVGSTIGNPIVLASYMTLFIPICMFSLLQQEAPNKRFMYLIIIGITLTGLLLTFSRGGWLSASICIAIYLFPKLKIVPAVQIGRTSLALIVTLLMLLAFLSGALRNMGLGHVVEKTEARLSARTLDLSRMSAHTFRISQYKTTAEQLIQHPFLGIGFGTFTALFEKIKHESTPGKKISDATTTENMFLMFACETGFIGVFSWIVLLVVLITRTFENYSSSIDPLNRDLYLALLAGLGGFIVNMMTWDAMNHPAIRMCFWMLAGIAMRPTVCSQK